VKFVVKLILTVVFGQVLCTNDISCIGLVKKTPRP